jgi:hypothetical protein
MNRTVNDNYKWNPATDTIPMLGDLDVKGAFAKIHGKTSKDRNAQSS